MIAEAENRPGLFLVAFLAALASNAGADAGRAFDSVHGPDTGPRDRLTIEREDETIRIRPEFLAHAEESIRQLEQVFGPLEKPLVVKIGQASTTLRIAYDPSEDAISMPEGGNILDHGLEAWDCLDHELFHAMVGRKHPALVSPEALDRPEVTALHEGCADYFASLRDDDPHFGENYHTHGQPLRRYREAFHYTLVQGSHAKGSALTRHLIDHRVPLATVAGFFAAGDIRIACLIDPADHAAFGLVPGKEPTLDLALEGHAPSRLHRYRLRGPTALRFTPNESLRRLHGELELRFTTDTGAAPAHFRFEPAPGDPGRFMVEPRGQDGEKIIASIHANGERVGFLVIYLSVARS